MTKQFSAELPTGFRIRIINPLGIVIMGRCNTLSEVQRREFEVLRRDSKGIVDIITYDDLLARLQAALTQLSNGTFISASPSALQAEQPILDVPGI